MLYLADHLQNRAWLRREQPFRHLVVKDVFTPVFYAKLAGAMQTVLDKGLSETPAHEQFARTITGYDAYGMSFNERTRSSLAIFCSAKWHALITGVFGVSGTRQINVGAHHHTIGSDHGFIHNDFNPVWFPQSRRSSISYSGGCDYKSGDGLPEHERIEVVRAVAMIFYLCNDDWAQGDGGETGLYDSPAAAVDAPVVLVPPSNNSLLLFECTPHSYHSFLHNPRRARTSIIMWAHRSMADTLSRWPADSLERWLS